MKESIILRMLEKIFILLSISLIVINVSGNQEKDEASETFTIQKVNLDHVHSPRHSPSLPFTSGFTCSNQAHGKKIAEKFTNLSHDNSQCPNEEGWFLAMAQTDPSANKFFVNIGVNKGYNLAIWLNVFFPFLTISPRAWHEYLLKLKPHLDFSCGVCGDCGETFTHPTEKLQYVSITSSFSHTDMLYADMNCNNIHLVHDILQSIRNSIPSLGQYASFSGVCAALSNQNSSITMPKCPESLEQCSLSITNADGLKENVTIQLITLDSLITKHIRSKAQSHGGHSNHHATMEAALAELQLQYLSTVSADKPYHPIVDLLMIDTEGHDYLVIQGAKQLIQSRSVRMIIFEYHGIPPWNEIKLEKVQKELDESGYDCYFEGQNRLWKITGEECWDAAYEFHYWSNVLCVRREDVWYEVIQPFVVKE